MNKAQPGHSRSDAPAQHELGSADIKAPGIGERLMQPRDPVEEPPLDPRVVNRIRMSDDTTSNDFPDIASNTKDRTDVWCAWQAYSGRRDEIRISKLCAGRRSLRRSGSRRRG